MDLSNLFGKVKEMQGKLQEAQENLSKVTAEGESGGGMVKAVVNGKKQLISLDIDPDLIKPDDKEFLQDLVVGAINRALEAVEEKAKEEMKKSTEGMLPNIPGMDFSKMM